MKRLSLLAGLAAVVLAGCASAPQGRSLQPAAAGFTSAPAVEYSDEDSAAAGRAVVAPRTEAAEAADTADDGGEIVVQGQVDAQDVHPGSQVVCKEMLQHASNVIRTRCLTRDGWKRYERAESQRAQAILRAWQGSPYAGF